MVSLVIVTMLGLAVWDLREILASLTHGTSVILPVEIGKAIIQLAMI